MHDTRDFASLERMAQLLNNALDTLAEYFDHHGLYGMLSDGIGMTDDEIIAAGFTCVPENEDEEEDEL
jgi:hypothetical protein